MPTTLDKRTEILNKEVAYYVRAGWQVKAQTDTTAQLTRRRGINLIVFVLLLCLMILPGLLYLILYKGEEGLYIEVDSNGHVKKTRRG